MTSSPSRDDSLAWRPRTTVITVAHNSSATLAHFWSDKAPEVDWVVVDNASSDDSASVARGLGGRVIRSTSNLGFSGANNLGARQTDADVLIFCNPDVRIDVEGVRALTERALSTQGLVAPQLRNGDGTLQENGRGTPFPHRKLRHMLGHHEPGSDPYVKLAQPGELRQVVWVMGAAVAMTREVFDRIGKWNDRYFIYYEDAEICLRALRHGVLTFVDGSTQWEHGWARETRGAFSRSAWRHEMRSGIRFYATHPYCVVPWGRAALRVRRIDRMKVIGE